MIRLSSLNKAEIAYPVTIIERQVHFIERLVPDMLDLTRIGTGKIILNIETVALRAVIDAAIETCSTHLDL